MSSTVEHSVKVSRAFAVEFKDIERWSVSAFRQLSWNWPTDTIKPLSAAMTRSLVPLNGAATKCPVPMVTLRFTGEMELRSKRGKDEVKGKLFRAEAGDLVYSKIDVRNGSIGIVPDDIGASAWTTEYPIYKVDASIADALYLKLVIRSFAFQRMVNGLISGASGRKRVEPSMIETLEIPLPSLATQRSIVAHWQSGMQQAAALETKAKKLVEEAQAGFVEALGIGTNKAMNVPRAFALTSDQLERWSVGFLKQAIQGDAFSRSRFPVRRVSDVVADLENGWSPQCHSHPAKADEWGVLKLGAVSFGAYDEDENKALPSTLKPIPAYEIRSGDVLISRANVPRYVGACAVVHATRPKLLLCDKIFRVVFKPDSPLDGTYFAEVMKTPPLRQQIEAAITGSSPTMQNITKTALLGLRIPVPKLKEQHELVRALTEGRAQAARMKEQAEAKRRETKEEVEGMVMGRN
ncbi:MAG: hypothetical protein JSS84_02640 [Bacteroidetes bacterium]|nr:hypothetical protein [Bacteroidota bacterium]